MRKNTDLISTALMSTIVYWKIAKLFGFYFDLGATHRTWTTQLPCFAGYFDTWQIDSYYAYLHCFHKIFGEFAHCLPSTVEKSESKAF